MILSDYQLIARAIKCPIASVSANWSTIAKDLDGVHIATPETQIAALATVAVETAWKFQPIHEFGNKDYFIKMYWTNARVRNMLGNRSPEDAWKYCGRGYIQTTGYNNYLLEGKDIGVDLIDDPNDPNDDNDPDKASDPLVAAALFADFFFRHEVYKAADARDWTRVRKLVNGGTNGLDEFLGCIARLQQELHV